jgi:hypothetical protein
MKSLLLLFAIGMLWAHGMKGQTFAFTDKSVIQEYSNLSMVSFPSNSKHHKICAVAIVGLSALTVGAITTLAGVGEELNGYQHGMTVNQSAVDQGKTFEVIGIVLFFSGVGMSIGGGIYDFTQMHKKRLGIITTKSNEIGLAYNF